VAALWGHYGLKNPVIIGITYQVMIKIENARGQLRRWRHEDRELEASMGYVVRPCLKTNTKMHKAFDVAIPF
jgi:hypothetical protein